MNSNQMPISGGLAVVAAVIIGYFVIDAGLLEGSRPGGESLEIPQPHSIEDVQARLWQDPFVAAAEHKQKKHPDKLKVELQLTSLEQKDLGKTARMQLDLKADQMTGQASELRLNPHAFDTLANRIEREWWDLDTVDVLAVMVSAGPYPENSEIRLRRRYAVIAGLAASGFQPAENTHIGYVDDLRLAYKDAASEEPCGDGFVGEADLPKLMPFEWFKRGADPKTGEERGLLLLWLDEAAFSKAPLCKLNDLKRRFSLDIDKFQIIGPHSSDTLKSMVRELEAPSMVNDGEGEPELKFPDLEASFIYSATATAAPSEIMEMPAVNGDIAKKFLDQHIIFFRSIADDRQLTDALVGEIRKRLRGESSRQFHVALVSEWDTLYGRSLPKSFGESAYGSLNGYASANKKAKKDWIREHVFRFSYLRGLDGSIGGEDKGKKTDPIGGESEQKKQESKRIESPQGRSQKDYLRRLAVDIALTHQDLKNRGAKGIQAIGILGSDVYDKLMILRALRKQFPKAIFFTTDLDASLMHPDHLPWTRNMLVASSFDLKIASNPEIRRMEGIADTENRAMYDVLLNKAEWAVPQNRDVYQTSVFLNTIWATSPDIYDELMKKADRASVELKPDQALIKKVEEARDKYWKAITSEAKEGQKAEEKQKAGEKQKAEKELARAIQEAEEAFAKARKDSAKKTEEAIKNVIAGYFQVIGEFIQPRVYEIGRSGAVDLSAINPDAASDKPYSPLYTAQVAPVSSRSVTMVAEGVVAFCFLMFLFWRRWLLVADIKVLEGEFRGKLHHADYLALAVSAVAALVPWACYLKKCALEVEAAWLLADYVLLMLFFAFIVRWCCRERYLHQRSET